MESSHAYVEAPHAVGCYSRGARKVAGERMVF